MLNFYFKDLALILVPIVVALIGYAGLKRTRERAELVKQLSRALRDLSAFYHLEQLYCDVLSKKMNITPLAAKRLFRAQLRASGIQTPSDHATPLRIESQLKGI